MIAELEIPDYQKQIYIKLLNEFGDQWHQDLFDLYSKDDPEFEIDPKLIDPVTGLAKDDLSPDLKVEVDMALKNSVRPYQGYEDYLVGIREWDDDNDEDKNDLNLQKIKIGFILQDWRDLRIIYWREIKKLPGRKARIQTYLDIEKLNLGGKELICRICGVFFYDNISYMRNHLGVRELYCSVNCQAKASFECLVCGVEYVAGLSESYINDPLRILRLEGICSDECLPIYKSEKLIDAKYVGGAKSRASKYGVEFDYTITRRNVFEKDQGKCYLCEIETHLEQLSDGYNPKLSTVDHVIPISKGGPHTWENVRNCCLKCNITKHDRIY